MLLTFSFSEVPGAEREIRRCASPAVNVTGGSVNQPVLTQAAQSWGASQRQRRPTRQFAARVPRGDGPVP